MTDLELLERITPLATPMQLNQILGCLNLKMDSTNAFFNLGRIFEAILRDNNLSVEKAHEIYGRGKEN